MKTIPPNPYTRKPIRRKSQLAGRAGELAELQYYFKLTRSGQSPHIALIGSRGVGKSSLLISCGETAKELNLLTVSLDMNAKKMSSQGVFWQQFYSAICFASAEAGCWNGVSGATYQRLLSDPLPEN